MGIFWGGNISDVEAPRHVPNPGKLFFLKIDANHKTREIGSRIYQYTAILGVKTRNCTILKYKEKNGTISGF